MDLEIAEFERGVLEFIGDMSAARWAACTRPEMIAGYKTRGRPVDSVKAKAKQAVTIRYSTLVLASFTLITAMLLPRRSAVLGCSRGLQRLSCK